MKLFGCPCLCVVFLPSIVVSLFPVSGWKKAGCQKIDTPITPNQTAQFTSCKSPSHSPSRLQLGYSRRWRLRLRNLHHHPLSPLCCPSHEPALGPARSTVRCLWSR